MAVSKKDIQSSTSSGSPSPQQSNSNSNSKSDSNSNNNSTSNNDNSNSNNSDSNSNEDPSYENEENDSGNGNSNSNNNSQPSSDGRSDQSNSNSNNNSNSDDDLNNGQDNQNSNSNSNGNNNNSSPPNSNSNGDNNNSSPPNSDNGNNNDSPPNSNSNGNNNNNSPPNSNSNGNNNNSPPNSNNGNNNSNSSPSPPSKQHNNNGPPQSNNSPSPRSLPRGSGRPMFMPPPPALKGGNAPPSKSSNGLDTGLVAGVVIGTGVLLILLVVLCVCLCKRKKKKDSRYDSMKYFPDDQKAHQYYNKNNNINNAYNNGQHGASPWHGSPAQNKQEMMANNYSGSTAMSSQQHWGPAMPPPPPPNMMSVDMSTGQYSSGPAGPALPPPPPPTLGFNKSTFTYDELAAATNGFSQANLIGQGGFGFVHKGVLPNGKEIAVKSLKSGSGQGEREFQAEVEIISRVHHRHLVSLVGYCIAGGQRMLVYEFIPNNTLEYHLHGNDRPVMDFATRMKIALGAAKGLAYLHEDCHPRIIHRDIKGANILIDDSFEAKVADFGLAKLSNDNYTHVSTRIMGTFGYLAPEYAASGKLTEKSDVFSFGVMLLELVTGKRPIDPCAEEDDSLVDWARSNLIPRALEEGAFDGLVDPRLEGNFDAQGMTRLIACAGAAIRQSGKRRPKMSQIVRALEGDMSLEALNEPVKPGAASGVNSEYDTAMYNSDMSKFRRIVLDSTEYSSSSTDSGGMSKRASPGPSFH